MEPQYKIVASYSMPAHLKDWVSDHCKSIGLSMAGLLEKLIKKHRAKAKRGSK